MSIVGSMFTASTALDAFSSSMAVVGHNIANLNTTGYKASRVEFADLLPTLYGDLEAGHGVRLASVDRSFTQGALESTSNATDLAIGGNGFFVLKDSAGASYYSRAGQFQLDGAYNFVNPEGYFLQGSGGNISLSGQQTQAAQATSTLSMILNLDAAVTTPTAVFPASADASENQWVSGSNFSTVISLYDSLGASHDLTFLFRKEAPNTWEYRVVVPRSEVDGTVPTSTDLRQLGTPGTLTFNANGTLNNALSTITDINGMNWVNGATSQTLPAAGLSFAGSTQYAKASALSSLDQDGWRQGGLSGVHIDAQGNVRGLYSNGNSQLIDTIQIADFANVDDLDPFGDTLFLPTADSGSAQIGLAGSGGRGGVVSGSLELSTVDLAAEFVTMLASQRAFQMNSRVITTAEEMYSVAADLKR